MDAHNTIVKTGVCEPPNKQIWSSLLIVEDSSNFTIFTYVLMKTFQFYSLSLSLQTAWSNLQMKNINAHISSQF